MTMTSAPVDPAPADEPELMSAEQLDVFVWRFARALDLGYDADAAASLAASTADLHDLERLILRGCALDVALDISW